MSIYIDKNSVVKSKMIGNNTKIWQYCVVLEGAKIGENVNVNSHCFIENDVVVGSNVTLKCGVYLWDGITIEDGVQVGPNSTFTNDKYPRAKKKFELEKIHIKEGASIGAACVILGGVTIGKYALIGAGSLVTKDVADYTLVYGSPAEFKGYICECSTKLTLENGKAICSNPECMKEYSVEKNNLKRIK